jgi:nucleoside-diphosphate-sugar epimerase
MEILTTGVTGLLGRYLIPALLERGHTVRALVLPTENSAWLEERGVAVYRGDVRDADSLTAPMRRVDTVFHLAGMMGVWRGIGEYRAVNVTGAENIARAVLANGVRRLVHVSSWTVYGMNLGAPARESWPLHPFPEPYARTKAEGDLAVQRLIARDHLPAVIIRPGTFFGPGDRLHYARMADRLRAGKAIVIGSGRNALPFVYATDVVQGLILAAERDNAVGQAYNITNDQPLSQEEFLRAIARDIGAAPPRVHVPYRALYAISAAVEKAASIARVQHQPIVTRLGVKLFGTDNRHAIDKARTELGYIPRVSLREGVKLSGQWYRQQHEIRVAPTPAEFQHATD